jgi:hypothetical protein
VLFGDRNKSSASTTFTGNARSQRFRNIYLILEWTTREATFPWLTSRIQDLAPDETAAL